MPALLIQAEHMRTQRSSAVASAFVTEVCLDDKPMATRDAKRILQDKGSSGHLRGQRWTEIYEAHLPKVSLQQVVDKARETLPDWIFHFDMTPGMLLA